MSNLSQLTKPIKTGFFIFMNKVLKIIISKFQEIDYLLGLRGLLAVMVILQHVDFTQNNLRFFGYNAKWFLDSFGGGAVVIFFVLSGYLLAKGFLSKRYLFNIKDILRFYKSRLFRIAPLYYFIAFVSILFVFHHLLQPEHWYLVLHIFTFTYYYIQGTVFNIVFWSLSVEMQFYIILPLLAFIVHKLVKNIWQSLFLLLLIIFYSYHLHTSSFNPFSNTENLQFLSNLWLNLDAFLFGIVAASITHNSKFISFNTGKIWLISIFPLTYIYLNLLKTVDWIIQDNLQNLFIGLYALLIIIIIESQENKLFKPNYDIGFRSIIKNPLKIINFLGHLSFGIYLWHLLVLIRVNESIGSKLIDKFGYVDGKVIIFLAVFVFSSILATITFYGIEKPMLTKKSSVETR